MDNIPGHISANCSSKMSNKLRSVIDGSAKVQDGSCLSLGFGCSTNSCIVISSAKKVEDDFSINLGLSSDLHLGTDKRPDLMNVSCGSPNPLKAERPKLDLGLSLSTGPAESAITTVSQVSIPCQDNVVASVTARTVHLVDEGSTSSRWKLGPLVPPLRSTETTTLLGLVPGPNNPTPIIPGLSSTVTASLQSLGCASMATPQQQGRNSSVKTCQFSGCIKGARGASGFCIAHGGGRRCQRAGCLKGAEGKTVFCKAHGGGQRCQHLGCTKSAEGRTDYCISHGGGRRCSHVGCPRAARGKSGVCIRHGGGKRCTMENCTRSAEGITGLCISHGGGHRCQFPTCTKGAQGSTMFCKAHGGGKRCTFLGCMKGAEGSTPFCKGHGGGKRCTFEGGCTKSVHGATLFCVNHGGGKRCAVAECTKSARGRTNFCVRHGGGKRCKYEGCDKSAQGSTDFCKGHGGGKRCSWGQSEFGGQAAAPCDKFSRGKSGLCTSHSSQVNDVEVLGDGTSYPTLQEPQEYLSYKRKWICASGNSYSDIMTTSGTGRTLMSSMGYGQQWIPMQITQADTCLLRNDRFAQFSLPEGRVHGGSLMAMLGGTNDAIPNNLGKVGDQLEPGTSYPMPHKWV